MSDVRLTGGCQCGAVRYETTMRPEGVHVCHCRMCQKAVAGPFAVICPVQKTDFRVTRGEIAYFQSSALAQRGFCRNCGTPLIFDYPWAPDIGILGGSLDHPELAPPVVQYGNESRVPGYQHLHEVPGDTPTYSVDPEDRLARIKASSRQHPDHDTDMWPTGGSVP